MLSLQVGFLPQLSGRENAILSGMLLGLDRVEAERQVARIEAFADLGDHFDAPLATYSSGMRARLGFSSALYSAAEVILIDEVLGVGDQDFREKSTAAIKDLIRSNRTVVLASHNPATGARTLRPRRLDRERQNPGNRGDRGGVGSIRRRSVSGIGKRPPPANTRNGLVFRIKTR